MKSNDVYKFVLKPGVPGEEINRLAIQVEASGGFVNIVYAARKDRRASLYAIFRVNQAPEMARTTATYTVVKEEKDHPDVIWDDQAGEWGVIVHPAEPSTS